MACTPEKGARSQQACRPNFMTKEEEVIFTKHAWTEAEQDGISESEIMDALTRGQRINQNSHFITIYKYFTVIYKIRPDGKYKIITVYSGYPRKWKN